MIKLQDFSLIRDTQWYEHGADGKHYHKRRVKLLGITIYRFSKQLQSKNR
ncbi:MAG: hypothetical protein KBT34_10270 [Prevotella sp.]|nr:hypothetical protein [Candidatus Prevotella equi]